MHGYRIVNRMTDKDKHKLVHNSQKHNNDNNIRNNIIIFITIKLIIKYHWTNIFNIGRIYSSFRIDLFSDVYWVGKNEIGKYFVFFLEANIHLLYLLMPSSLIFVDRPHFKFIQNYNSRNK